MSALSPELIAALRQMSVGAPAQEPAPTVPITVNLPPQPEGTPPQVPTDPSAALAAAQINGANAPQEPMGPPVPAQGSAPGPVPQPAEQPASMKQGPNRGLSPLLQAGLGALQSANNQGAAEMKKASDALDKAGEAQKTALSDKALATAETAKGLSQQDQEIADLIGKHQDEQKALQADVDKRNNDQLGVLNKAQQTYASDVANQKGFWADKDVASRIGWAIAVGLGAFGSSVTHTQNNALQLLEGAIADDTRLKERKLAGEKGAIEEAQNTLGQLRAQGLDRLQAQTGNQLLGLQAAKTRLQAYLDGRQGPEAAANAKVMIAQIDEQMAAKKAEFAQATQNRQMAYANGLTHVLGTAAELEDRKAQREYDLAMAGVKAAIGQDHISSDIGFTQPKNADDGKQLRDRAFAARNLVGEADKLKNMFGVTDANGNYHFEGRGAAVGELLSNGGYEQMVERLARLKMAADGDGVPSGKDMENAKKQLGLPESLATFLARPEMYLGLLDRFKKSSLDSVSTFARGIGVKPRSDTWWDLDSVDHLSDLRGTK